MSAIHQNFPTFDKVAQREISESAKELLDGLWTAYAGAA